MGWAAKVALVVGLLVGGDALAAVGTPSEPEPVAHAAGSQKKGAQNNKKGNQNKGGQKKNKGRKGGIEVTGIKSFDKVFHEVGEIDQRLFHAETQLRQGRQNLNAALDLPKGTPFADALTNLQSRAEGNLRLALSGGGIPQLEATDAIPANVQSAVDGFNGFTKNLSSSIADTKDLSKDISRLVDATSKMPQNLVKEFSKSSNGTVNIIEKLFVLPGAVKATSHNIKIVTGLDDRVKSLTDRTADLVGLVNSSFQPAPKKGGGGKGGGNGKKKGNGGRGR